MLRRYTVILSILYFVVLQGTATAALSTVRVLVLPFTIHADQDLSYLKTDIPKVIGEHLESEGAVLLEINDAQKKRRRPYPPM